MDMKREFLQNFKVGDQALSKEVIDAIMAENGRDIESAKKPFADYDTIKTQLGEAQAALEAVKKDGTSIEDAQKAASEWEEKYNQAVENHKKAMAERDFNDALATAITGAKGKNAKAIMALLDLDALRESKDQTADIKSALETCQKENEYLFGSEQTPPPYAGGTGFQNVGGGDKPMTLASALHEHYKT